MNGKFKYRNKEYRTKELYLPKLDEWVNVSTEELVEDLEDGLRQEDKEAQAIDEQIFYYLSEEEFAMSDEELIKLLDDI